MTGWGAAFAVRCECGAEAEQDVGQALRDGRVCWDSEFHCRACGAAACMGFGAGDAPRWVRGPLIAEHGTVRLRLADPNMGRIPVLQTLLKTWNLSLTQAVQLSEQLAGDGLPGTLPEAEWLRDRLAARRVRSEIVPGAATDEADWPWAAED
ncbi:hypothetical protein ACFV1L_07620 [Kitasatospora sp. NPDC059646]|uniref:hypothetical protein n=1 Tax=Kitasatospora sp. NPDC059646 TaxID=3346893 RepID=UPI00368694B9